MGRAARGVKAMTLREGDKILSCDVVSPDKRMLVICDQGRGKRVDFDDFNNHNRGGMGTKIMNLNEKTGDIAASVAVKDDDELLLMTAKGMMIRINIKDIRELSRQATGAIIVKLNEGDSVADCSIIKAPDVDSEEILKPEESTGTLPFDDNNNGE